MRMSAQRRGRGGRRFFVLLGFGAVVTLPILAGCADVDIHGPDWTWDGDLGEVRNTDHAAQAPFRYPAAAAETLSLRGVAGSVEIVGSADASGIMVEGLRRVRSDSELDAQAHLPSLTVDVWSSGGTLFVETRRPAVNHGRAYEVEYRIEVPTGTNLTVVHVSGPVEIRSVSRDVQVDAVAGALTLLNLTARVQATVVTGSVDASVALPPNGLVELRSSTGNIHLSLPTETSASLRAATVSGAVHVVDVELTDEDPRAAVLKAIMGGGDGTIRLETALGDITVQGR
jgi:hypothetical protein